MLSKKLLKHLEKQQINFEIVEHKLVYTAFDAAATMKVKLNQIAKSLLVKFNKPFVNGMKPYAIVIIGADKNIDLKKLKKVVNDTAIKLNKELRLPKTERNRKIAIDSYNKIAKVIIPKEKDLKNKIKAKPGAMAAFGSLYKIPVFVDRGFMKTKKAIFSGDSYTQSIKMLTKDFLRLEGAFVGNFAIAKKFKKPKLVKKQIKMGKKNTKSLKSRPKKKKSK